MAKGGLVIDTTQPLPGVAPSTAAPGPVAVSGGEGNQFTDGVNPPVPTVDMRLERKIDELILAVNRGFLLLARSLKEPYFTDYEPPMTGASGGPQTGSGDQDNPFP